MSSQVKFGTCGQRELHLRASKETQERQKKQSKQASPLNQIKPPTIIFMRDTVPPPTKMRVGRDISEVE